MMSESAEMCGEGKQEFDPLLFRLPGWHVYRGMMLTGTLPISRIKQVQQLQYLPDDIVVASYPKTGM
jgi:hypothetical protein